MISAASSARRPDLAGFRLCNCLWFYLPLAGSIWGCAPHAADLAAANSQPSWFANVARQSGIDFVHRSGPQATYFMPALMGSGCALFDYDNDGRLDLYLLQNLGPATASGASSTNRLFHQRPDGHFDDVSTGSGLDVAGYGMGVAAGDVNNDGLVDLFVAEFESSRLLLNQANGRFIDVTASAGVDNRQWGTSASFVDYNRDGWLDLVVVNYVDYTLSRHCTDQAGQPEYCGPTAFPGSVSRLYRNDSGAAESGGLVGVRFRDVTVESGLGSLAGPALGVVCLDFDGDGWQDILVANDGQPNRLWINQHDGTLRDEAVLRGIACNALGEAQANMGIAVGDVDRDGLPDIYVTHLTEQRNVLWMQGPRGMFLDRTATAGLTDASWRGTGFGAALADFNCDGHLDLAVVNGRVLRSHLPAPQLPAGETFDSHWRPYAERNQLFAGRSGNTFADISPGCPTFCGHANVARGLAVGDIDSDGGLDLVVTAVDEPVRLYRNTAQQRGHWLLVRAVEPEHGGRDSYGAQVTIAVSREQRVGWVLPGSSFLVSNDPRVHFGLGTNDRIERIDVLWPDGAEESFTGGAADRLVIVHRGAGSRP